VCEGEYEWDRLGCGWETARCEAPKSRIRAQVSLHYRGSDELGLLRIVLAVTQTQPDNPERFTSVHRRACWIAPSAIVPSSRNYFVRQASQQRRTDRQDNFRRVS